MSLYTVTEDRSISFTQWTCSRCVIASKLTKQLLRRNHSSCRTARIISHVAWSRRASTRKIATLLSSRKGQGDRREETELEIMQRPRESTHDYENNTHVGKARCNGICRRQLQTSTKYRGKEKKKGGEKKEKYRPMKPSSLSLTFQYSSLNFFSVAHDRTMLTHPLPHPRGGGGGGGGGGQERRETDIDRRAKKSKECRRFSRPDR